MKLSIVIPAYNEEKTIGEIVEKVSGVLPKVEKEIIAIDDGSTDKTRAVLSSLKDQYGLTLFFHGENRGKGAAIRTALPSISGDFAIIQDADLEYNPEEYGKILDEAIKSGAEAVYGSRQLGRKNRSLYASYYLGNVFTTRFFNLIYGASITDLWTCYKLFRSDVLKSIDLECRGFEFCPEVTAKLARKKAVIREVPISYNPRGKTEGKKIKWADGLFSLWVILKNRF